jgi:glycosyltransferase involved in cell wall biosynthesis
MEPVLFVTGHVPPERVGAFAALHEREGVEVALFGGRALHALAGERELPFPHRHVTQRDVRRLAASGDYRAVIGSTGGRVALPGAYRGARAAGVPFVLWASLWAHPRSLAGAAGYLPLRRIYRGADAVVTYGPHVSAYVRAKGARNVHEAPQAVDNAFWSAPPTADERRAGFQALFVGRPDKQKGLGYLLEAWNAARPKDAVLVLAGPDMTRYSRVDLVPTGVLAPEALRNFYAAADVLCVPSVPTRTVRETWGLAVNEAFNQATPVIATDAVGAAAGGLVRDGENGFLVPAKDPDALAAALRRLVPEPRLRERMGAAGRERVSTYTFEAWAEGFSAALRSMGAGGGEPQLRARPARLQSDER